MICFVQDAKMIYMNVLVKILMSVLHRCEIRHI